MKTYKVVVLGATGAVGQGMIKILTERSFPIRELHLLVGAGSAGKKLIIANKKYIVKETIGNSFDGMDIALGAAGNDIAEKYLPIVAEEGAIVMDNSSVFRLDEQVSLIIPEMSPQIVREHHGIIANPDCATIIALVAPQSLHAYANAKCTVVPTYQTVSGAGISGICGLNQQVGALARDKEIIINIFWYQIAYDLVPQIGGFNKAGYFSEEMGMQNGRRKIMSNPELCVNCICACVSMIRSHSESIIVELEKEISVEKTGELLQGAPGVKLVDEPQEQVYPTPLDTTDQGLVSVGRIREGMSGRANTLDFWCCGDQIRKRVATNVVQIAKLIIQKKEKQQE